MFGDLGNLDCGGGGAARLISFLPLSLSLPFRPPNEIPEEPEMNRSHARNRSGIPCGGGEGRTDDANNAFDAGLCVENGEIRISVHCRVGSFLVSLLQAGIWALARWRGDAHKRVC